MSYHVKTSSYLTCYDPSSSASYFHYPYDLTGDFFCSPNSVLPFVLPAYLLMPDWGSSTMKRPTALLYRDLRDPRDWKRLHPSLRHRPSGKNFPAMVCAVTRGTDGAFLGVHRTYLRPDGLGKAPVSPAKMSLGPCRGGVIRQANGPGKLHSGCACLSPHPPRSRRRRRSLASCCPSSSSPSGRCWSRSRSPAVN